MSTLTSPLAELIDGLLAQPTSKARAAFLRQQGRYDAETLEALATAGDALVRSDPSRGAQLAEFLAELAEKLPAPLVAARALYLRAQAHALAGEWAQALPLIAAAREGFLGAGRPQDAIRTHVGEMHALAGLGRYPEALAAGEHVLALSSVQTGLRAEARDLLLAAMVAQNQGLICNVMGRYSDALAAFDRAAVSYKTLEESERLGHIHNNRGVTLLSLGRGGEAIQAFQEAADLFAAKGLTLLMAQTQANRGASLSLTGGHRAALEAFETAQRAFEALGPGVERGTLDLDTATAYLALNLYPEALATCDEALAGFRAASMPYEQGQALVRRASALAALGQPAEAEVSLAEAETIFRKLGNEPWLAIVWLEQTSLWELLGRSSAEALAVAQSTLALCQRLDLAVQGTYAHLRLADLLADQEPEIAQAHLEEALTQAKQLALPQLRYRAHARLGRLYRLQDRTDQALHHLTQAIDEIERLRATLPQETLRTAFLRDKMAPYEDLIQLYLARGDEDGLWQAFAVAERARSRALLDLLAGSIDTRLQQAEADAAQAALQEQLKALRADLDLIYNELLAADTVAAKDEQRSPRLARLQGQAHHHEQEISRLRLRLEATGTGYLDVSQPLSLEALQAALPPEARLLAYYITGDPWSSGPGTEGELLAFIVNSGPEVKVHRRLTTPSELLPALSRLGVQWNRFRLGAEHVSRHQAVLERSARAVLADLYDQLVRPLADDLDSEQLIIVPYGPLHGVPFHALYDGQSYLIERYEISYATSATVMARCQTRPRRPLERALVVGVPDAGIPYVAQEAETVAALLPGALLLQGQEATMPALRAAAPDRDLLHLACHGLFRADNPLFSALRLADGWLTVAEAAELEIEAGLVTLSACESGRSRVVEGDELLGLTRAFLGGGAASLVVSLWLVNDASTAQLMEEFYRCLQDGQSKVAALRAAQRTLLATKDHPYYWAPFVLVGQR